MEMRNALAWRAPLSLVTFSWNAMAPSFSMASRGSTPLGQRSLQNMQRVQSHTPCSPEYSLARFLRCASRSSAANR